jgi:hypothetical protein
MSMRAYVEITRKDRTRTYRVAAEPSDTNGDAAVREWCRIGKGPRAVWERLEALKKADPDKYERYYHNFGEFFRKNTGGSIKVVIDKRPIDENTRWPAPQKRYQLES